MFNVPNEGLGREVVVEIPRDAFDRSTVSGMGNLTRLLSIQPEIIKQTPKVVSSFVTAFSMHCRLSL